MPKLSGNKGEWSEIYAFLRLLEIKKLYAADAELNKKDDMFYNIINIIRTEPIGTLEFRIISKQFLDLTLCNSANGGKACIYGFFRHLLYGRTIRI